MSRPSALTIDLGALAHNARFVRTLAGWGSVVGAVKADAYGHGLEACAQCLAPLVDALAVAFVDEAIAIRELGLDIPILVLEGPFDAGEVHLFAEHQLWPALHHSAQLSWLEEYGLDSQHPLWLKLDTGMHRLGFAPEHINAVIDQLQTAGFNNLTLMSHLAHAEEPDCDLTRHQLSQWRSFAEERDLATSLMNSAGLLHRLPGTSDWLRPGYMLYGGRPGAAFSEAPLKAVMTFSSAIMAIRDVPAGETVGYGGTWSSPRNSRIATIPVGYGDGYPRGAGNGTPVLIDGMSYPLAGRVSMDMITVDVTDHPNPRIGARCELWGEQLSVDTVASHAGTIGYELMTRMPPRLPRTLVSES